MVKKNEFNPGRFIMREWPLLFIILMTFIVTIIAYPYLPERISVHWNIYGQIDRYSPKGMGAFQIPVLNLVFYVLFFILPKFDPKKENYQKFAGAYRIMRVVMIVFFALLHGIVLLSSLGYPLDTGRIVKIGTGVLFVILGNFMGQFRHNYFVGIRTPWTLANEEVWRKTHRLAGFIWVLGGFLVIIISPFQGILAACSFGVVLAFMVAVPFGYSFYLFKNLQRQ